MVLSSYHYKGWSGGYCKRVRHLHDFFTVGGSVIAEDHHFLGRFGGAGNVVVSGVPQYRP